MEQNSKQSVCGKCGRELPERTEVCPFCGQRTERRYQPMSRRKTRVIRWIVGGVLLAAFVVLYIFVLK